MKHLFITFLALLFLGSCGSNDKKKERSLPPSGGTLNNLTIVSTNELWNGAVGDKVRDVFASSIYGLPQDEPQFNLKQMLPKAFHELVKKSRTFVELKIGKEKSVRYIEDLYASPQTGIIITATTPHELVNLMSEKALEMVAKLKTTELVYKQQQINQNPFDKIDEVTNTFGIDIALLFSYRIAKNKDNFMWLRKDIKNGDMNVMIYELPENYIKNDSLTINRIVQMRDSIGKTHIPGPTKGSYMITEKAFTPFMQKTNIASMPALETRGTWDVKNDFMAGPFVNYVINDSKNKRQLVVEGFTYAPQINKRDFMFELEAIARSIQIK